MNDSLDAETAEPNMIYSLYDIKIRLDYTEEDVLKALLRLTGLEEDDVDSFWIS